MGLPDRFFGEGITVTDLGVWQLTWQSGVALLRDESNLREIRRAHYDGEGWGLCSTPDRLVMSDGSAELTFRDPENFDRTGSVIVRLGDERVTRLNELDCDDGSVWANVWRTDKIVRIDPRNGRVTAVVHAGGLLSREERESAGVLNGIASVPGTDEFLLTGKNWPRMFRVEFVPA